MTATNNSIKFDVKHIEKSQNQCPTNLINSNCFNSKKNLLCKEINSGVHKCIDVQQKINLSEIFLSVKKNNLKYVS